MFDALAPNIDLVRMGETLRVIVGSDNSQDDALTLANKSTIEVHIRRRSAQEQPGKAGVTQKPLDPALRKVGLSVHREPFFGVL